MKKIVVKDYSLIIIVFSIIISVLALILLFVDASFKNSYALFCSWKGFFVGCFVIAYFISAFGEKIKQINISDNDIQLKITQKYRKKIINIPLENINNCNMNINTDFAIKGAKIDIKLEFNLINNEVITVNHKFATPLIVKKISDISDYVNNFSYNLCAANTPRLRDSLEKILNKDKKFIIQEQIYSIIISVALCFAAIVIFFAAALPY